MSSKSIRLTGGAGWGVTRECLKCGRPETACICSHQPVSLPPARQTAHLRLEKRCGKPVTVVAGLVLAPAELEALLKEFKTCCGAGGTSKSGQLEIQGNQLETLRVLLVAKGFRCKGG